MNDNGRFTDFEVKPETMTTRDKAILIGAGVFLDRLDHRLESRTEPVRAAVGFEDRDLFPRRHAGASNRRSDKRREWYSGCRALGCLQPRDGRLCVRPVDASSDDRSLHRRRPVYRASASSGVILGLATLMMLAGLIIDLFEPGWPVRLGIQVLAGAALAAFGTRVTLFWPFTYPIVGGLVTTLWVVGLVNAFDFLDNMDGLATGIGLIASLLFAVTQVQVGSLFSLPQRF